MTEKIQIFYTTWPNMHLAKETGEHLVEQDLAKCINIFPGALSIYKWKGKTEKAQEVIMIIKAKTENTNLITKSIKNQHPYETPCLMALQINEAYSYQGYLDWILQ